VPRGMPGSESGPEGVGPGGWAEFLRLLVAIWKAGEVRGRRRPVLLAILSAIFGPCIDRALFRDREVRQMTGCSSEDEGSRIRIVRRHPEDPAGSRELGQSAGYGTGKTIHLVLDVRRVNVGHEGDEAGDAASTDGRRRSGSHAPGSGPFRPTVWDGEAKVETLGELYREAVAGGEFDEEELAVLRRSLEERVPRFAQPTGGGHPIGSRRVVP